MNYKHIAIIALVLMLALVAVPVSAQQFSDYENKYVPVSDTANLMTYSGHVYGNVKSGHVLDGGEIFIIHRDGAPENATMTARFTPDGLWDGYLPAGEYNITLPQGTGSAAGVYTEDAGFVGNLHPETTHISVMSGRETYFSFIGNSVPTARGLPDDASIDVGLTNDDVQIQWIKLVKTGEHQYTPSCYDITVTDTPAWDETVVESEAWDEVIPTTYKVVPCTHIIPEVSEVPAWTEYFGDYKTHRGHYEFVGINAADYDVTFSYVAPTSWYGDTYHYGDYSQSGDHYNFVGSNNGDYVVHSHTEVGHTHHVATPAVPAHPEHTGGDTVVDVPEHTITHPASTHVVHHAAVTHQQQVCPGPVTIPEFGFEYQIDITRAHVDINNPNNEPVDVKFSFDLNYFVDTDPWFLDHDATDGSIIPQVTPVYGHWENVGAGVTKTHGFINPPVGPGVMVYDWSHGMQYFPAISNAQVTSTSWS